MAENKVFISYSHTDQKWVQEFVNELQMHGIGFSSASVIPSGVTYIDYIHKQLLSSTFIIVVITPESMRSEYVRDEISLGLAAGKYLLPILLRQTELPSLLRTYQYISAEHATVKQIAATVNSAVSRYDSAIRAKGEPVSQNINSNSDNDGLTLTPDLTVNDILNFLNSANNNDTISELLDALLSKVVLILGNFSAERKIYLDAIWGALRDNSYIPVLFDFTNNSHRSLTETVSTLAHLSRFIIADLTEPRSVAHELSSIVPTLGVPVQPLIQKEHKPYAMFKDLQDRYQWVLQIHRYESFRDLLGSFKQSVIRPPEEYLKLRNKTSE